MFQQRFPTKTEREAQVKKSAAAQKNAKRKQNTKSNKKKANKNSAFLEVGRGCCKTLLFQHRMVREFKRLLAS